MDILRTDLICKYWALHCSWDDKAVQCSDAGLDCKSHVCNHAAPTLCWVVQFSWTLNYTLNYMDTWMHGCWSRLQVTWVQSCSSYPLLRNRTAAWKYTLQCTILLDSDLLFSTRCSYSTNCTKDGVHTQKCSGFDCIYAVVIGGGWAIRRLQIGTKWEPAPLPFWIQMKLEPFP